MSHTRTADKLLADIGAPVRVDPPVPPVAPPPVPPAAVAPADVAAARSPRDGSETGRDAGGASSVSRPASGEPQPPSLTDFLELDALQQIQDSFTALTHFSTSIVDRYGQPITHKTDVRSRTDSDQVLSFLLAADEQIDAAGGGKYTAPIVVDGHVLGSIAIEPPNGFAPRVVDRQRLEAVAARLDIPADQVDELVGAIERACGPHHAAGVQFLYLLAGSITRLCYKDVELRRRVRELSALYRLSTMLAGYRHLQHLLDAAVDQAAAVMQVKAATIRLLDDAGRQLVPAAVAGLSESYLNKGPVVAERSEIFSRALLGEVVSVDDVQSDPRIMYPDYAKQEGLASMLAAGMIYRGRPIGVIQLFSEQPRHFGRHEIDLLRAMSQLLAAAIENARLDGLRRDAERVQRQVRLAADVQKRMLPRDVPELKSFDLAARYVPCTELGGDFYDFIPLQDHIGIVIGDAVGKGIAASLLMASVRASLRAYAQDVYDIDEIISRVNVALTRDTLDKEFATLFYGVLDPRTGRLTYCNAGHEPALLLRDGQFTQLNTGGMIVGVDGTQRYERGVEDLQPGDLLLLYSDGLPDAQNFDQQRFGRQRIMQAMRDAANELASAHHVMSHVLWEMRRFAGLNERTDDTTLVVLRVREDAIFERAARFV